jgi:hypothetical protein
MSMPIKPMAPERWLRPYDALPLTLKIAVDLQLQVALRQRNSAGEHGVYQRSVEAPVVSKGVTGIPWQDEPESSMFELSELAQRSPGDTWPSD